jgi:hypothetical protein
MPTSIRLTMASTEPQAVQRDPYLLRDGEPEVGVARLSEHAVGAGAACGHPPHVCWPVHAMVHPLWPGGCMRPSRGSPAAATFAVCRYT